MTKKIDIGKLIKKIKAGGVVSKGPSRESRSNPAPTGPIVRDMRAESIALGSHGAVEFFGEAK